MKNSLFHKSSVYNLDAYLILTFFNSKFIRFKTSSFEEETIFKMEIRISLKTKEFRYSTPTRLFPNSKGGKKK